MITVYTDGSSRGNPGPGGYAAVVSYQKLVDSVEKDWITEIGGRENHTTNNRMELTAVIRALEALKRACHAKVFTDSVYVQKGISEWIVGWKARNWRTAAKKPVKNDDLWRVLDVLAQQHTVEWVWVKGHAGNAGNERADMLANKGVDKVLQEGRAS